MKNEKRGPSDFYATPPTYFHASLLETQPYALDLSLVLLVLFIQITLMILLEESSMWFEWLKRQGFKTRITWIIPEGGSQHEYFVCWDFRIRIKMKLFLRKLVFPELFRPYLIRFVVWQFVKKRYGTYHQLQNLLVKKSVVKASFFPIGIPQPSDISDKKEPIQQQNSSTILVKNLVRKAAKARNMCKIFSLVPSKKPPTRENWEKLSVYFSIFEWKNWSKHQFCRIA